MPTAFQRERGGVDPAVGNQGIAQVISHFSKYSFANDTLEPTISTGVIEMIAVYNPYVPSHSCSRSN